MLANWCRLRAAGNSSRWRTKNPWKSSDRSKFPWPTSKWWWDLNLEPFCLFGHLLKSFSLTDTERICRLNHLEHWDTGESVIVGLCSHGESDDETFRHPAGHNGGHSGWLCLYSFGFLSSRGGPFESFRFFHRYLGCKNVLHWKSTSGAKYREQNLWDFLFELAQHRFLGLSSVDFQHGRHCRAAFRGLRGHWCLQLGQNRGYGPHLAFGLCGISAPQARKKTCKSKCLDSFKLQS